MGASLMKQLYSISPTAKNWMGAPCSGMPQKHSGLDGRVPMTQIVLTWLVAVYSSLTETRKILFETGIGAFFEPKYAERYGVQGDGHVLLTNLNRMNISDADIDVVVLSHLHFDHAGGLLSAWEEDTPPKLLFPNAKSWSVKSTGNVPIIHTRETKPVLFLPYNNCLSKVDDWNW